MSWFIPRVLMASLAAAVGALLGLWLGRGADVLIALTIAGGSAGAAASALIDRVSGYRLMRWVREDRGEGPPNRFGFWAELGYRIDRALREREQQLETERTQHHDFLSAIEASPNGMLLLDPELHLEWCSTMGAEHFGLDPQRDLRQRLTNLVRDPVFVDHLHAGRFEQPVIFAAPRRRATLSVIVRRYGEDGRLLVITQDITERERAESMRRDFVANVSHEIRTPLTVLAGFVETLAELPLTEVERHRVLGLMSQQTGRMQALVADLLTLAQLEGSPRPPPDHWHPLAPLLERVLFDGRSLSEGRHSFELQAGPAADLAGSATELQSAIGNLVTNAVRYTPEGGQISLRWQLRADGHGVLEVRDTGPGIAREHLARLTERFYRVDGSRSRETGGTGLGLSIVKHVMQRHGGEIEVDSELGRGSCFRLVFPSARVRSPLPVRAAQIDHPVEAGPIGR